VLELSEISAITTTLPLRSPAQMGFASRCSWPPGRFRCPSIASSDFTHGIDKALNPIYVLIFECCYLAILNVVIASSNVSYFNSCDC